MISVDLVLSLEDDLSFEEFHADPFSMKMEVYPYPLEAMRYMCDGLHPNDLGYEMIADILAEEIIKNLEKE